MLFSQRQDPIAPDKATSAQWPLDLQKRLSPWPIAAGMGLSCLALLGILIWSLTVSPQALGPVGVVLIPIVILGLLIVTGLWIQAHRQQMALHLRMAQVETLLAQHPALTLVLSSEAHPLAAYGAAPVALSIDHLFDQGLMAAIHTPDRPAVQAALQRAQAGHQDQVRFSLKTALDLKLEMTVRPLMSPEPRLIAVIVDASLQHAREEGLRADRVEAEAHNLSKSRVLANVSHELRTPLNAVLGFSEIMVQGLFGPLPTRYADYAQSIHDAGRHLLDLIGDLLDVSRIEAERYELALEDFDVREVVASALALVRVAAAEKGLTLAALLPSHPVRVTADRRAIKQITLNLLSNAVKFTPQGGSITASITPMGTDLELVVGDTGLGIEAEDLARLGRPYEQAGDTDQKAQGTGLGLSLVRALTELHNGTLTIDSTPGSGTAATVRLPVISAGLETRPELESLAQVIPLNRRG